MDFQIVTSLMDNLEYPEKITYRKSGGVSAQSHVMFVTVWCCTPVAGFEQSKRKKWVQKINQGKIKQKQSTHKKPLSYRVFQRFRRKIGVISKLTLFGHLPKSLIHNVQAFFR